MDLTMSETDMVSPTFRYTWLPPLAAADSEAVTVSGHTFRRAEITASDGSRGAVLYGSTDTGFGKIYYLLSPTATDADAAHVNEILSTVTFAEFETDDGEEDIKIYVE